MPYFSSATVYGSINPQIIGFYENENTILDIGCGEAHLAGVLKKINSNAIIYGLDISDEFGVMAKKNLDYFYQVDLDRPVFPDFGLKFDLIILGDILEHLKRPDLLLVELGQLLSSGGSIIISVPNVANFGIRWRLLFGRFDYTESGVLDKTHLKFFTDKTMRLMIDDCGFKIRRHSFIFGGKLQRFSRIDFINLFFHRFYRLFAFQLIYKITKK